MDMSAYLIKLLVAYSDAKDANFPGWRDALLELIRLEAK